MKASTMILAAAGLSGFAQSAPALGADALGFAGPHVEVLAGYDSTELPNDDGSEPMYALEAGYDRAMGPWLIGAAFSVGRSNADKTVEDVWAPNDRLRVRYGTDVYAGLRFGRALSKRLLPYARAGLALTEMRSEYSEGPISDVPDQAPELTSPRKFERPGTLLGFWVGGGFEYRIGKNAFALAEYRYSNFHDGLYRHQAVAGIGLRL
jgi:outer membrane immunogenic protein